MTDVVISSEDVIVTVEQPTVPPTALPPNIGLVEIEQVILRGSIWLTGSGAPVTAGGQTGDLYLDVTTGDIYRWEGNAWVYQGTFAPSTLTGAEILAELITVDGAGSGLDADLLDGHDSPYFAVQTDMTAVQAKNTAQDTSIANNAANINTNTTSIANNTTAINTNATAIATETTNRTNADTTLQNNINLKANIASPVFTGDPQAPTPAVNDNDTSIATTQFVTRALAALPPSGVTAVTGTAPVVSSGGSAPAISMPPATGSIAGHLTAADWTTFNAKLSDAPNDGSTYGRKNLAWTAVSGGGGAATVDTPPASPINGQLWWKSSTGQFFIWYQDVNTAQWVQVITQPVNPPSPGAPFKRTMVSASSTTFQYDPTTIYAEVEVQGAGGGGGGTVGSSGAGTACCASGGGAGGYAKLILQVTAAVRAATKTITIGAGGTSAAGSSGTVGGATSYADTVSTVTGNGGSGGGGSGYSASIPFAQGGAGGTASGGDISIQGARGLSGTAYGASTVGIASTGAALSGPGGDSRFGIGGFGGLLSASSAGTTSAGGNGTGYGSGGGGGAATNAAASNVAGGAGGPGLVIITEYR